MMTNAIAGYYKETRTNLSLKGLRALEPTTENRRLTHLLGLAPSRHLYALGHTARSFYPVSAN